MIHFGSDKQTVTVKISASEVASALANAESLSEEMEAIGVSERTPK